MSQYPTAADPADIMSLRKLYEDPIAFEACFTKENGVKVSIWVMRNTEINRARYNAIYDAENPPAARMEALEKAGATFYPRCK